MNTNKFDKFTIDEKTIAEIIKEIPLQFDKAITEMTKTAEMIGKVIKENLDDAINTTADDLSRTSSGDSPETSVDAAATSSKDVPEPSSAGMTEASPKSTLTPDDMVTLLEVNDARERLNEVFEVIVGDIGIGSEGLMSELDKIRNLIVNVCPTREVQDQIVDNPNEWIYELLDDKTIDNERKARMLLGV